MSDPNTVRATAVRIIQSHEAYVAEHGNPIIAPNLSTDAYTVARAVERLTADNAALAAQLATVAEEREALRAAFQYAADQSRISYYDRTACSLCRRFEGHEHDCPFAALAAAEAEAAGAGEGD